MTALPAATAWTDAGTTQGGFKTAQTDLRNYLAGLFGADGVAATARAALAVPPLDAPTLTTFLIINAANTVSMKFYSDAASQAVIESFNTSTPATKYLTNIAKYGGGVRLNGDTGLTVVDDASGSCVGINHLTPAGTARLSVVEAAARYAGNFSGASQVMNLEGANESYANAVLYARCHRAANTAYKFFEAISDSNGTPDTEFNLRGDGTAFADGAFTGSGADYQEYFQSADGTALAVGECVVLDGDTVRVAAEGDTPEAIIGVVRPKEDNKNSAVVGNAAWNHWSEKYLTDDYGRYVQEDYRVWTWEEVIPAVKRKVTQQKMITRPVLRMEPVVENGRAVMRQASATVTEGEYREVPLFDDKGRPIFEERPVLGADGSWVMTESLVLDKDGQPEMVDGVPAVRRDVVKKRVQAMHREPVMETVEMEVSPARTVRHEVVEGKIPAGVTMAVPAHATETVLQRRKLNPDYRADGGYTPRHERPEWNLIGLLGQVQIRNGAMTNPRWVRMKAISEAVSLWYIR